MLQTLSIIEEIVNVTLRKRQITNVQVMLLPTSDKVRLVGPKMNIADITALEIMLCNGREGLIELIKDKLLLVIDKEAEFQKRRGAEAPLNPGQDPGTTNQ